MTYRIAHSLRQLLHRPRAGGQTHRVDCASSCVTNTDFTASAHAHAHTHAHIQSDLCIDSLPATQVLDAQTSWPTHRIRSFLSTHYR